MRGAAATWRRVASRPPRPWWRAKAIPGPAAQAWPRARAATPGCCASRPAKAARPMQPAGTASPTRRSTRRHSTAGSRTTREGDPRDRHGSRGAAPRASGAPWPSASTCRRPRADASAEILQAFAAQDRLASSETQALLGARFRSDTVRIEQVAALRDGRFVPDARSCGSRGRSFRRPRRRRDATLLQLSDGRRTLGEVVALMAGTTGTRAPPASVPRPRGNSWLSGFWCPPRRRGEGGRWSGYRSEARVGRCCDAGLGGGGARRPRAGRRARRGLTAGRPKPAPGGGSASRAGPRPGPEDAGRRARGASLDLLDAPDGRSVGEFVATALGAEASFGSRRAGSPLEMQSFRIGD